MTKAIISTRAIDKVINNPTKLKAFKIFYNRHEKFADNDALAYFLSTQAFTLVSFDENKEKFARFNEIIEETNADFGYLLSLLTKDKCFADCYFKISPIVELYESLLRENWEKVKNDRELLNSIDAFDRTAEGNIAICHAIVEFLKEHVLNKNLTNNV